jgi:hypothetical protein
LAAVSGSGGGFRANKKMVELLGPVSETALLPGEMVAVRSHRDLARRGRCVVRVRIFGSASLGWLDSFNLWGACIETFVCQGGNVKHLLESLYPDIYVTSLATATQMPPHGLWDGILVATVHTTYEEGADLMQLISIWRPE